MRTGTFLGLVAFASLIMISYNVDAFAEDKAIIEFLEESYAHDGTAVIRVTDSRMDNDPFVETVDVVLFSGADTIGTTITLRETDNKSGIFEGTVFFVLDDYTSGNRLQVVQGDFIYATYKGTTSSATIKGTPSQITDTTEFEEVPSNTVETIEEQEIIESDSVIRPDAFLEWTEDSYGLTDTGIVRVVDSFANNNPDKEENLDVIVYTMNEDWEMEEDNMLTLSLTETGLDSGIFEATIFFSEDRPSQGHRLQVEAGDLVEAVYSYSTDPQTGVMDMEVGDMFEIISTPISLKKQLSNAINPQEIQCSNPEHVLVERSNGKLACVFSETAEKLNERGWVNTR